MPAAVQVALPLVWLGLVVGIEFIEARLKSRAPEMTLARGVSIGRIVFRALDRTESAGWSAGRRR